MGVVLLGLWVVLTTVRHVETASVMCRACTQGYNLQGFIPVELVFIRQYIPYTYRYTEFILPPMASPSHVVSSVSGTARSVQTLADTPADSELRFKSRAVLPGYAKYLREVGPAVNAILTDQGLDYDAQLSSRYGGAGEDTSPAEVLLERIGATITLSGRCGSCILRLHSFDSSVCV